MQVLIAIAVATAVAPHAQPRLMVADVQLPATAEDIRRPATVGVAIQRRVATAADPRTAVAARHTVVADRTVAVAADMGGNTTLGPFPA